MKKVLFIFILLAVFSVVGITLVALSLTKSGQGIYISYTDPITLTQEIEPIKTQTQLSKWVTDIKRNTSSGSIFDSWQESNNIKHSDYIPRAIADEKLQEVVDVITADITQEVGTSYDDYYQWGWKPRPKTPIDSSVPETNSKDSAIIDYGNSLGVEVKTFAATIGDQPKIMSDFIAGRGQPSNKNGLLLLAKRYTDLGTKLTTLGSSGTAPAIIKELGLNLANAYQEVGDATRILAESETTDDASTVESIYTYHKSVDAFAMHFVAFSDMLVAYGAEFKSGEGGDIFMPPM